MDRAEFSRYVDRGILADTVKWVAPDQEEALRWLFFAQISLATDEYLEPRVTAGITELDDLDVFSLAVYRHGQERHAEAEVCFREINRRLDRERWNLRWSEDQGQRFEILSELVGLVSADHEGFTDFVAQFSNLEFQESLAENWTAGLRRSKQVQPAIRALSAPIASSIQGCLSRHVAVVGADEGVALPPAERNLLGSPYAWVYQILCQGQLDSVPPDEPSPPKTTRDYSFGQNSRTIGRYVHDLFFFLVVRELQSSGFCEQWAAPFTLRPWLASSLKAVAQGVSNIVAGWRDSESVEIRDLFEATSSLRHPSWDDQLIDRECADGVRDAFLTITEDLLVMRRTTGGSGKLQWVDVESIASHKLVVEMEMLGWIADGRADIEREALENLCTLLDEDLSNMNEPFGERATKFSLLAACCARNGLRAKAEQYLRRSSENLLAYGYHKDLLLHVALNAIEVGADHWDTRQQLWYRLAPAIASITELTDGDETSNLACPNLANYSFVSTQMWQLTT